MTAAPHFSHLDESAYDLLALVADPGRATGRDAVDAFLAACRRDARANGGMVSINRVRELLSDAGIQPRRYSSLWSHFTGEGTADAAHGGVGDQQRRARPEQGEAGVPARVGRRLMCALDHAGRNTDKESRVYRLRKEAA